MPSEVPQGLTWSCTMFKRREGTAGISGQLYETKLLSLLYFRAIHDDRISEFQLASNVADVGAFDDICFKATVDGFSKPVLVFIQAKHKENTKQTLTIDLTTYFISYLKIRQQFVSSNKDLLFVGTFDEPECLFVIYTPARDEFCNDLKVESSFRFILSDLIGTGVGGTTKQPYKEKQDVESLCKIAIKYQITVLAERIAKFIMDKMDFQQMLSDTNENIILRYHVILAQKVLEISEVQPKGHRIATFRRDFFDTDEEYLILFRDTLFKEILKKRKKPSDIKNLLSEFIDKPTDAEKLSKLIVTVITYTNGLLQINKQYAQYFRPELNKQHVSRLTVDKAVELAAKEILLSPEFKLRVPAAFGNKDITVSKKSRIELLTLKITELLDKNKFGRHVTIDESFEDGFLRLNGGIAGAIGNIFVLDDNTKLMKITDKVDALGTDARSLYENLNKKIVLMNENISNDKIPNISEYKFCFKVNKFPKLLLDFSEHEENLAQDFLKKLLFFSSQADENGVEEKVKQHIEEYQRKHPKTFQAKTDAIFLKFHDNIQDWWMKKEASYLTKKSDLFQNAMSNIIEDPLMNSLNVMFMSKIKHNNHTFTKDAMSSLNLQDQHSSTVIVAENSVLTVVKVIQHLKNKDHVVLDLEDIVNLPTIERNTICRELTNTNKNKVLLLVCNKIQSSEIENETFKSVAESVRDKKTIIITNDSSIHILQTYFATADDNIVHDEKNSLIDMNEESQMNILENARVKFQGIEVGLEHLLCGWPQVAP